MKCPRPMLVVLMVGPALLALSACDAAAPHAGRRLTASAANAPRTYEVAGTTASATTTSRWSAKVTVSRIARTNHRRAQIAVGLECSPSGPACRWSGEAAQTGATCPVTFDAARAIWNGPAEATAGTEHTTVTFQPINGVTTPHVCMYVND